MIRDIIWDVDGTLFDTYPAITYALSQAVNGMGQSVPLNVIDGLARESISLCVETLSQRFKLDPGLLRRRYSESYRRVNLANQPPFPGVREVCEIICGRNGLNIIVTHRDILSTRALLKKHALSEYFEDIFSVEQGYPRKPDPAMLLAALEKYCMDPLKTIFIGDRDLDIQAGSAAGMRTLLFGRVGLKNPADFRIESYAQLLSHIKKLDS